MKIAIARCILISFYLFELSYFLQFEELGVSQLAVRSSVQGVKHDSASLLALAQWNTTAYTL